MGRPHAKRKPLPLAERQRENKETTEMEHMRDITVLRSAKEPPEITVRIQSSTGKEGLEKDMMRDIAETIQKRNRQSARTDGFRMAWRIELV